MTRILKDLAIDTLPVGDFPQSECPLDYEGVDFLAETMLVGMSNWLKSIDQVNWRLEPWFAGFHALVNLLRWCVHFTL
jgi:hypothetical protein